MRLIAVAILALVLVGPILLTGEAGAGGVIAAAAVGGFLLLAFGILLASNRSGSGGDEPTPDERDRRYLAMLVLVGFTVRVVIAAAIHRFRIHEIIAPDEETFHANGRQFCLWLRGESPYRLSWVFLDSLQVGYYYLVGIIYYVFGVERFLPIFLNCAIGSLAALPVYSIAKDLGGREAARPSAFLVTFFPSLLLWSTLLIRDSLVILLLLVVIRSVMRLRREFSLLELALFLLYLIALGSLRQYLFLLVASAAVASFLVGRAGRTGRTFVVGLVVIVGLLGVMNSVGYGVWELERASLHHLNMHRQYNTLGTAAGSFAPDVDISRPVAALTWLPVGMLYFLGSPFPWQVISARQVMALPDVVAWYMLLLPILSGLGRLVRTRFRDVFMLLITISLITVLYSLVEGNVGIIFRHRAQVIAPTMILAGVGISIRNARRRETAPAATAALPVGVAA